MPDTLAQESIPSLYRCVHCGEDIGKTKKLYCRFCSTALQRKAQDEENEKIFASAPK